MSKTLLAKRQKGKYEDGIRAANTDRIRKSPLYKKLNIRYRILSAILIAGMVLAIGDNAEVSIDSRNYGFVSEENVLGRVFAK